MYGMRKNGRPRFLKAWETEISRKNVSRWSRHWSKDDEWLFAEDLVRPALLKLNLGCGEHVLDGWANLDPRSDLDASIIKWDFSKPIPFGECKADVALTSHVFNYVQENTYENALLDIWRVLRPGGILRMAEDRTDNGYIWRMPGQRARGTGVIRSLPTKEKIVHALKKVGFEVHDAEPGKTMSPHKDILKGDTRPRRYKRGHKFYIEAVKAVSVQAQTRPRLWDKNRLRRGYFLQEPPAVWHESCDPQRNEDP
jgi:predicted SAM-dependent methyltransferase